MLGDRRRGDHDSSSVHSFKNLLAATAAPIPTLCFSRWLRNPFRKRSEEAVESFAVGVGVPPLAIVFAHTELSLMEISLYDFIDYIALVLHVLVYILAAIERVSSKLIG